MAAAPLESLGRYTLSRVLGKGAMGVVYEGRDPRLNRTVAIKTILVGELDADTAKDYSMRFAREAQAVARLNHPNIVQVYDFGEEGEIAYIVMEYIRGKELKAAFDANERFALKDVVRLMAELLDALEFAHNAGVVHRDIKPANVMVDADGHAKLADFGVARISDPDKPGATQVGTMVGTPAYMSPEQVQGNKIDRRTDIFSAGVILYQFLTRTKPFQGGGAWSVAKMIVQDDPPAPSLIVDSIPPEFDRIVFRALAKNPDKRYQSALEFAQALQRALEGQAAEDSEADKTQAIGPEEAPWADASPAQAESSGTEVELEFWGAIKDSDDPEELDLYIQNFPYGVYVDLAKRKKAEMLGPAGAKEDPGAERLKREAEEKARREAQEKVQREAAEKARREAEARAKLAAQEKAKREALEKARLEAEEKARLEAEARAKLAAQEKAKREALEKARREAEEKARLEAEARARQEARERAMRAAEERAARAAALVARREAEEKARREAEEKALREAVEKAQREAAEKAQREAAEKAQREAEAMAKREGHENALRAAEQKAMRAAEIAPSRLARQKARREAGEKVQRDADERVRLVVEGLLRRQKEIAAVFKHAVKLEGAGKVSEAMRLFEQAAYAGSGPAARRLGELYSDGASGVSADSKEAQRWFDLAESLGEKVAG